MTHSLNEIGEARYVVRRPWRHGLDDHSLPRWDATSTIHREMAVEVWVRRSLTSYMGWDKDDTS